MREQHVPPRIPNASFVPDLLLERYRLGELPAAARAQMEIRLTTDPLLRDRLAALDASDHALLAANAPEDFARKLHIRREAERRVDRARFENPETSEHREQGGAGRFAVFFPGGKPLLAGLAVSALLVLASVPAWRILRGPAPETLAGTELALAAGNPDASDDGTRIKGLEPSLAIFRKTANGSEPLRPGEKARPGEFLRIGYNAGGFGYGAIYSVDGNGSVTRHWPASGEHAARLENGEALLPTAFELDAAPRFERFYLIVSQQPFALDPLPESLRAGSAPHPPAHAKIVRFDVLKDNGI